MGESKIYTSMQKVISFSLSLGLIALMCYCIPRAFYISQVLNSEVYDGINSPTTIQFWQFISRHYFYLSSAVLCLSAIMLLKNYLIKKLVLFVSSMFVLSITVLSYFLLSLAVDYKVPVTTPYGISLTELPLTIYLCFGYLVCLIVTIYSMSNVRINENV